jgi:DNA-binding response OmpR family regulator
LFEQADKIQINYCLSSGFAKLKQRPQKKQCQARHGYLTDNIMPQQKKMLIVDDELDFCALVILMLKGESFHIDCAHTLYEASKFLSKDHPEIILLDHNLPDGTGLDYFYKHRIDFDDSKIVLMTADPSPDLKSRAEAAGIEFTAKPFGLKRIREIIRSVA